MATSKPDYKPTAEGARCTERHTIARDILSIALMLGLSTICGTVLITSIVWPMRNAPMAHQRCARHAASCCNWLDFSRVPTLPSLCHPYAFWLRLLTS